MKYKPKHQELFKHYRAKIIIKNFEKFLRSIV